MRFEYRHGDSLPHRLDVRVKLTVFALLSAMTFQFADWFPNVLMTVLAVSLLMTTGVSVRELRALLAPMSVIVVLVTGFAAFGYQAGDARHAASQEVLFSLLPHEGLPLTAGGLAYGIGLGLRIVTMVILTTLLLVCTPLSHFTAAMRQARVPHPLVFIVMTALRFIPTMQSRADHVLDAQRARGARIDSGGMIGRVRAYIPIMVPLLTSGIRMSEDLAAAMINRGYGATKRPTALLVLHAEGRDYVVLGGSIWVFGAVMYLKTLGWWTL